MAILKILHHPDPRLRNIGKPVEQFDDDLQTLIDDMFETMYDAPGVGLAATQVGIALRLAVMDCSAEKDSPIVMINPEIIATEAPELIEEGCLSVPGHYDKVQRHGKTTVKALDREGKPFELTGEGLLSQCIQHEIDHLDGKLYIDYLSQLKRNRIRRTLEKQQRLGSD